MVDVAGGTLIACRYIAINFLRNSGKKLEQ